MKVVWESSVDTSSIAERARIIDVDGDMILEVLTAHVGFWKRIGLAIKWAFTGKPIVFTRLILDEDIKKIGGDYGKENSEG